MDKKQEITQEIELVKRAVDFIEKNIKEGDPDYIHFRNEINELNEYIEDLEESKAELEEEIIERLKKIERYLGSLSFESLSNRISFIESDLKDILKWVRKEKKKVEFNIWLLWVSLFMGFYGIGAGTMWLILKVLGG